MLENKDYCDYETCVALKELGYSESFPLSKDYEVLGKDYDILLYEAQKWLREEKKIHIEVYACAGGYMWELCKAYETNTFSGGTTIYVCDDVANPKLNDAGRYDSYEEALSEGIKESVKILKENKL
jgi:hypothetical protein